MHFTSSCFEGLTLMFSDTFVLNNFHFLNIVLRTEAERNPICSVLTKRLGKMQWNNMAELRSWLIWLFSWPICIKPILNGLINIMKCQMGDKEDTKATMESWKLDQMLFCYLLHSVLTESWIIAFNAKRLLMFTKVEAELIMSLWKQNGWCYIFGFVPERCPAELFPC